MEIYLVENSPLVAKRLCDMLSALPGVIVLGQATRADDAIRDILRWRPEAVLLDLELDQGSGFDVLNALRESAPEIDFYMLTNHVSPGLRRLAADMGAKGYYDKTRDFDALCSAMGERARRTAHATRQ
jgi:DNA-binding NarL/FixJ family response regulator